MMVKQNSFNSMHVVYVKDKLDGDTYAVMVPYHEMVNLVNNLDTDKYSFVNVTTIDNFLGDYRVLISMKEDENKKIERGI